MGGVELLLGSFQTLREASRRSKNNKNKKKKKIYNGQNSKNETDAILEKKKRTGKKQRNDASQGITGNVLHFRSCTKKKM